MMSSELEQVLLKVTRPDDVSVKSKHLERLVAMSYSVPRYFDLYFNVLRKLWGKMAEGDWRTKCKVLYVLHKFAAEGRPTHAQNLKGTLRKMRRTRDDMRHCKYFNSQRLMHLPCKERAQFRGAGPHTVPKKRHGASSSVAIVSARSVTFAAMVWSQSTHFASRPASFTSVLRRAGPQALEAMNFRAALFSEEDDPVCLRCGE